VVVVVHRVAALDSNLCQSKKCGLECIKFCPVNLTGGDCIVLGDNAKAVISEELCTGCGICIQKCPFEAITILNLAEELKQDKIHQYGINTFRLYKLPTPIRGAVVGLVGRNGVGKTTALNILAGSLKPNLGRYEKPPDWDEILDLFSGTELKNHFETIALGNLKVSIKPQAVYSLPKAWSKDGAALLSELDTTGRSKELVNDLSLRGSLSKKLNELSGGELQRLAIAVAASKEADLYLFDEPSSFNDIYQRMAVSNVIRALAQDLGKAVILVEHDLTMLDYVSDYIHVLYGDSGVYGVVSSVQAARKGINVLLDGYLPAENVRFRDAPVKFNIYSPMGSEYATEVILDHGNLTKDYDEFRLEIESGTIHQGEIIGVLGANALGKSTYVKMIAGVEQASSGELSSPTSVSYKPQYLSTEYDGNVGNLLTAASGGAPPESAAPQIVSDLGLRKLLDFQVKDLSGGELQRAAIASCLMRDAGLYVLDEPSAFIDVEERLILAKLIQKFVKTRSKSALIVDHDIQMVDIVSDTIMIFTGEPGRWGKASSPKSKEKAMNQFLTQLGITYRRDVETGRPRVNKPGSKVDREQKRINQYYYLTREETES
jgi:ATP-binding cassette subfamily E protein 1